MEKGGEGRYEDAEHHRRNGYGQATVEEAHILSNPIIGSKWTLDDDDDDGWLGSRIVWMTGKVGMVKCVWVCVYAPVNENRMKGKMKLEKFWEDLGQLLKTFENVRRVFLL